MRNLISQQLLGKGGVHLIWIISPNQGHTDVKAQLGKISNHQLWSLFLDCRRKPECPEKAQTCMRRTSTQKEPRQNLNWGEIVNHCTTTLTDFCYCMKLKAQINQCTLYNIMGTLSISLFNNESFTSNRKKITKRDQTQILTLV